MRCFQRPQERVEDKEGKTEEERCAYTCQVTLEQMVKSKYSPTGTEDSGLTL